MSIDFSFLDTFEQQRVLIVDDDRFIRGVLDKLLRMIGFEAITHAEDGADAHQAASGGHV